MVIECRRPGERQKPVDLRGSDVVRIHFVGRPFEKQSHFIRNISFEHLRNTNGWRNSSLVVWVRNYVAFVNRDFRHASKILDEKAERPALKEANSSAYFRVDGWYIACTDPLTHVEGA